MCGKYIWQVSMQQVRAWHVYMAIVLRYAASEGARVVQRVASPLRGWGASGSTRESGGGAVRVGGGE